MPSEQGALCSEAQVFSSKTAVLPKTNKTTSTEHMYVTMSQTGHTCTCISRWNPQVKEGNNIKNLTFKIKLFLHNKQECTFFFKIAYYTQL